MMSKKILAFPKNNPVNPYNGLLYRSLELRGWQVDEFKFLSVFNKKYSHIHLHWPESVVLSRSLTRTFALNFRLALVLWCARIRGAKIVWTGHNSNAHDAKVDTLAHKFFWFWFPRTVTHLIALSESSITILLSEHPLLKKCAHGVAFHGHYRDMYAIKYKIKNEPFFFIGYLGLIRKYKNIPILCREFAKISDPTLRLNIRGRVDSASVGVDVSKAVSEDKRICFIDGEIPDSEIPSYFSEIDLFVISHAHVLNSGGLLLALSFNIPVLAPDKGSLREVAELVGPDWVMLYSGDIDSTVILKAINWVKSLPSNRECPLSFFDWDTVASQTEYIFNM